MGTLIKIAWRNLFRQRRRTTITVSAMAISLAMAIPTHGLTDGMTTAMLRGLTRMELGQIQIHDPAYPRGKALQSTLRRPEALLAAVRATDGVEAAAPRVHGNALASHDVHLPVRLAPVKDDESSVRIGRAIDPAAAWRTDPALACEATVQIDAARANAVTVGTVFTPKAAEGGAACERVRIVGLTAAAGGRSSPGEKLTVSLAAKDIERAFGKPTLRTAAILRHAAAVALWGIDPTHEQRVTFMHEKLREGRNLSAEARGEVVVGERLAKALRLSIGAKLFIQAGSLDQTSGTFYRDLQVVGIYRTGVDTIDRTRVFVHIADAQQVTGLESRAHEIAIVARDPDNLGPLAATIRERIAGQRLEVTTSNSGRRAGSRPLGAPVAIFERSDGDVALLIPYDLRRRFDALPGLDHAHGGGVARRVYAATRLRVGNDAGATGPGQAVRLVGVEPVHEPRLSQLDQALASGRLRDLDSDGEDSGWPALISQRLARRLGTALGATFQLQTRDVDGHTRWQPARVVGLLADARWAPELPELVLPYFSAQQVDEQRLNARAHEILLMPAKGVDPQALARTASQQLSPLVRSWKQIAPDMAKLLEMQDVWIEVMLLVIFSIAAMTVMNTMLMAVFERTREFGVLKSIGMRPRQVFGLIILETLAIALTAVIVGGGIGAGLNHYLEVEGLDLSAWTGGFTYQGTFIDPVWRAVVTVKNTMMSLVMVCFVCLAVSFYPALRAGRLRPVEALRHHG